MLSRQTEVKAYLAAALLAPALAACSSSHPNATPETKEPSSINSTSLTHQEVARAISVARQQIAKARASVYSVTAAVGLGAIKSTNTGHPCTSGRVLTIKLIGKFPHTVTSGHPVQPGQPVPDFTVRAEIIKADAKTGTACLIGVQTAEHGEPKPLLNGVALCGSTGGFLFQCFRPADAV